METFSLTVYVDEQCEYNRVEVLRIQPLINNTKRKGYINGLILESEQL